ncbi:MAG: DNA methyltransferase Dim-2 [Caeruleum heppii]|nr:MAG: DNA methyltransferase Dim-2 [Caeruleum heppii]
MSRRIDVGEVVGMYKDGETRLKGSADLWYAYVQGSTTIAAGHQGLEMRYPFHNELFFSNNCNCYDKKFYADDVVCLASVALFKGPEDASFVTLKSHLNCSHCRASKTELDLAKETYRVDDTVLYQASGHQDPPSSEDVLPQQDCKPNELVYTTQTRHVKPEAIYRKCLVYTPEEEATGAIMAPYNRDGNGDAYYITTGQTEDGRLGIAFSQRPHPRVRSQGSGAEGGPLRHGPLLRW